MSSDMLEDDEHAVSTTVDSGHEFDNDNNNDNIDDDNVVIDAADLDANDVAALVAANEERNNS